MNRELQRACEVVAGKVCEVGLIVDIVDFDLVGFTPLKVILDVKALDPAWAQVVHDDLGHAKALPLGPLLAIED